MFIHCYYRNYTITPVPGTQPCWIWVNLSNKSTWKTGDMTSKYSKVNPFTDVWDCLYLEIECNFVGVISMHIITQHLCDWLHFSWDIYKEVWHTMCYCNANKQSLCFTSLILDLEGMAQHHHIHFLMLPQWLGVSNTDISIVISSKYLWVS